MDPVIKKSKLRKRLRELRKDCTIPRDQQLDRLCDLCGGIAQKGIQFWFATEFLRSRS